MVSLTGLPPYDTFLIIVSMGKKVYIGEIRDRRCCSARQYPWRWLEPYLEGLSRAAVHSSPGSAVHVQRWGRCSSHCQAVGAVLKVDLK